MNALLVGVGGLVGSLARYGVNNLAQRWFSSSAIPLGTLIVNLVGCVVVGLVTRIGESAGGLSEQVRALVVVGVLGGFTTFSAFGNETIVAFRGGHQSAALMNATIQVVGGLACVLLGRGVGSLFAGQS